MSQKREDYELNATIARHLGYAPDPTDTRPPQRCTWLKGERGTPGAASHWPGPLPYTERLDLVAAACEERGWGWAAECSTRPPGSARRFLGTVYRSEAGPNHAYSEYSATAARALSRALAAALHAYDLDTSVTTP